MDELLVCLVVPGDPVPKGRARVGRNGTYTPERTVNAEQQIAWLARNAYKRKPDTRSMVVECAFYCRTHQRRDIDNLTKLALDALNGIVWIDDQQVHELHITLERGVAEARTELRVYAVGEPWPSCATCGKAINRRTNDRYCSRACYDQRQGEALPCSRCGQPTYRRPSRTTRSKKMYCSAMCKAADQRGAPRPPGSWQRSVCPQNHPLSGGNLYLTPSGRRVCRACQRAAQHRYQQRKRATRDA